MLFRKSIKLHKKSWTPSQSQVKKSTAEGLKELQHQYKLLAKEFACL